MTINIVVLSFMIYVFKISSILIVYLKTDFIDFPKIIEYSNSMNKFG